MRKIAMLGTAPSTRGLAPFNEDWEVWCQADYWADLKRIDRWFEFAGMGKLVKEFPEYLNFLKSAKFPVYMRKVFEEIPSSVEFPFDKMANEYGREFMSATVVWMMTMAVTEHLEGQEIECIGLWGYDMALDAEYCVAPQTRALMADLTWKPVGDLDVGDKLIAFDELPGGRPDSLCAFREWRMAEVETIVPIFRPSYRIYFADGSTIVSSAEHRWMIDAGNELIWRRTDRLRTKYHNRRSKSRIVKLTNVWQEDRSWDAGYVAAAFDGEGWLGQNCRKGVNGVALHLGFSQKENAMSAEVIAATNRLGFNLTAPSIGADCLKYRIAGTRATNLEFLGRIRPRRLLAKFDPTHLGALRQRNSVAVEEIEYLGQQEVMAMKTTTGTFIAEGFASHNSSQRPGIRHMEWICRKHISALGKPAIDILVPKGSDLLVTPIPYPFADDDPIVAKARARKRDLNNRLAYTRRQAEEFEAKKKEAELTAQYLSGALEDVNYWERMACGVKDPAA